MGNVPDESPVVILVCARLHHKRSICAVTANILLFPCVSGIEIVERISIVTLGFLYLFLIYLARLMRLRGEAIKHRRIVSIRVHLMFFMDLLLLSFNTEEHNIWREIICFLLKNMIFFHMIQLMYY